MKLLVFSDSHGMTAKMESVLMKINKHVNAVFHLGDGFIDMNRFIDLYNKLEFHQVVGNCDFAPEDVPYKIVTLAGKKILITHGHRYGVRSGLTTISMLAKEQNADICLFGHTHVAGIIEDSNIVLMNPGSISRPKGSRYASYGVIEITENGSIHPSIVEIR